MVKIQKKIMKLNMGCGKDIKPGFINVDYYKLPGIEKVYDFNKFPYPFKDNTFNFILMRNILEHLSDPVSVMNELHRISKPSTTIYIRVPHFSSCNVWGDIEHKRGYNYSSFASRSLIKKFEIVKRKIIFSHWKFFMRPFVKLFPYFYEKHLAYIFNAVDLVVELKVKKITK